MVLKFKEKNQATTECNTWHVAGTQLTLAVVMEAAAAIDQISCAHSDTLLPTFTQSEMQNMKFTHTQETAQANVPSVNLVILSTYHMPSVNNTEKNLWAFTF